MAVPVNPPGGSLRPLASGEAGQNLIEQLGFGVESTHPDYNTMLPDWNLVRDAIDGEQAVKAKTEVYLPKPSGFKAQPDDGAKMYETYLLRAKFPEILAPTLRGMVGIIHRVAADISLPEALEPMRDNATWDGLNLDALHQRITFELLGTGRYGLLVDMPENASNDDTPYIVGYTAEQIINWDSLTHDFFVLDESYYKRLQFAWQLTKRFRVCMLVPPDGETQDDTTNTNGSGNGSGNGSAAPNNAAALHPDLTDYVYNQIVYETTTAATTENQPIQPSMKGGETFNEVPFVVIGSTDVTPDIDEIPMIGVVRCAFTMYRLYADYFWQLFMSGQETLFVSSPAANEKPVTTVGAGVVVNLPQGSEAKYVGPSGVGINVHKIAIEDERDEAMIAGARIFDTVKKTAESGEALKMRWAAQTASLTTIAINSAKGLEQALKYAAQFLGADPDEVIVKPNLQFIDTQLDAQKAVYLMQLWMGGAISKTTLYENLQRGEIASYERTLDEEQELIDKEMPDIPTLGAPGAPGQPGTGPGGLGGGRPAGPASGAPQKGGGGNGGTPAKPAKQGPGGAPSRFVETGKGLVVK
jgi:hypothetical protein